MAGRSPSDPTIGSTYPWATAARATTRDRPPAGNGQDPAPLGAICGSIPMGPIRPATRSVGGPGPFGGPNGCLDGLCEEIFAFGFRNPFRFSFDAATGDLSLQTLGSTSWRRSTSCAVAPMAGRQGGSFCFDPNGAGSALSPTIPTPLRQPSLGLIDPIAQYDHTRHAISALSIVAPASRCAAATSSATSPGRLFALDRWDRLQRGGVRRHH